MGQARHSWREASASALAESDPEKLLGRIEYALTTLERRYSEWGTNPGTAAEVKAIQRAILALERQTRDMLQPYAVSAAPPETLPLHPSLASGLEHVRRLFLVLRS
jgi:hypothetical protein